MYEHPPPDRKNEDTMTPFEFRAVFKHAIKVVLALDIPPDIKEKIKNALELELQDVTKK